MKKYIDPKRFPEWYSAQYTEQDRKIIKEITNKNNDILRRQGRERI
jgi:hypothetical protein